MNMKTKIGRTDPYGILSEFLKLQRNLSKPPERRSNNRFVGKLFANLLFRRIAKYVPKEYTLVQEGLWIEGLEWVEWDGAIATRSLADNSLPLFKPHEVVALFEVKARGVYGGEKVCKKSLQRIGDNFQMARNICGSNLRCCTYVTLQERSPKKKTAVDYHGLTKSILQPVCLPIMLFESPVEKRPLEKAKPYLGQWELLVEAVSRLE